MKLMILAAGRGTRMKALTAHTAKPLLKVWGRPMLEWHLLKARAAGFHEVIINTAHCAEQFEAYAGSRKFPGLTVRISREGPVFEDALETKGGIVRALGLLADGAYGAEPFAVISGDIVTAYDYRRLKEIGRYVGPGGYAAHLTLVPNPYFKDRGDMTVESGRIRRTPQRYTYGNIAVFSPEIFAQEPPGREALFPWFYRFIEAGRVRGELYEGPWANVGSPLDLSQTNAKPNFCFPSEAL